MLDGEGTREVREKKWNSRWGMRHLRGNLSLIRKGKWEMKSLLQAVEVELRVSRIESLT